MCDLLYELARFILDNPELRKKKNYEIYNIWSSKARHSIENFDDVKLALEFINDITNAPPTLLADSIRKE